VHKDAVQNMISIVGELKRQEKDHYDLQELKVRARLNFVQLKTKSLQEKSLQEKSLQEKS
jgi:hypothetical protein